VPTYEYTCTDCGEPLEAVQKFSDDPLTVCPSCGGKLRKVFSPVGIVFKGSGFYRTDSRNGSAAAAPAKVKEGVASESSGSNGSSDSKPAESKSGDSKADSKKAEPAVAAAKASKSGEKAA
jgi:putative FmdB family regulatory protein